MKIDAYKSVGLVNLGTRRGDLINLLGAPEREAKSRIFALEIRYPGSLYRFDSDDVLKEISIDAPELEIKGESVSFEHLGAFLEQRDTEMFERSGFLVSPRYGLAFDQYFPSWVTFFPREDLQLWRAVGSKE